MRRSRLSRSGSQRSWKSGLREHPKNRVTMSIMRGGIRL